MLTAQQTQLSVRDLTPRIGSEIRTGVQTLLGGVHAGEIRALLEARGILAFPELRLTDQQQVSFTKTLGAIVDEGENNIYKITMDPWRTPAPSI